MSLVLAAQPLVATAQAQLKGRVVEESNRQGLSGANLLIRADSTLIATAATDAKGFFSIKLPPATYRVTASLIGYGAQEISVAVGTEDVTVPAFVLKAESIPLAAIEVNAERRRTEALLRNSMVLAGARMAHHEQRGARMGSVVRELNGVRVREFNDSNGRPRVCVEARRPQSGLQSGNGCPWVEVVVDGIPVGDGEQFFRTFNVAQYESIEFMDGIDAQKYGSRAGQFGALVLWSRGRGPYVSAERNKN